MYLNPDTIAAAAKRAHISPGDLITALELGDAVTYQAGDFLFHESTPRQWLGIVIEGEVEIVRGAQARSTTLATLTMGALIGEGVVLDDSVHASSAVTRQGATVWQIPRAALDQLRLDKPEIFY